MAKERRERISNLTQEIERVAKNLRGEIRRATASPPKALERAANELRKRIAAVLAEVEKYVRELRKELEKGVAKKAPVKRKRARARSRTVGASSKA